MATQKKTNSKTPAVTREAKKTKARKIARKNPTQPLENLEALSPKETRDMLYELQGHQIELEMQNEELRRAQAELDASRARYFDLYDLAPVGYCTLSEKGLILEANLTAAALLGLTRDTLIKQPLTRFIHKEDQDIYYQHRKQLFKTHSANSGRTGAAPAHPWEQARETCELRMKKNDETIFWAHLEAVAAQDADGAFPCRVVISDITARKQGEEALRQSEERYRYLFERAPVGIGTATLDGRILESNNMMERITGFSSEELKTINLVDTYVNPSDRAVLLQTLKISGNVVNYPALLKRKDGSAYNAGLTIGSMNIAGEKIIQTLVQDVTKHKQAEEALRESEERFRSIVENSTAGYFFIDCEGYFQTVNATWLRLHKYDSPAEILGRHFSATQIETDQSRADEVVKRLLAGETLAPGEFSRRCKDGSIGWHTFSVNPVRQSGKMIGLEGFLIDITARKRAEEEVFHAAQEWQRTFDAINAAVWIIDKDHLVLRSNQAAETYFHRSPHAFTGKHCHEIVHGTKHPIPECPILRAKKSLQRETMDLQIGARWFEVTVDPLLDGAGRFDGAVHIVNDITERKRVEVLLRGLSSRQEAILSAVPEIIIEVNNHKIYTWTNQAGYDFFGDDVIGNEAAHYFIGAQDTYQVVKPLFSGSDQVIFVESWQRRKDGEKRLLAWWCRALKDENGNVTGALSSARDITEHKQAEEALQESEERFRKIFEQAHLGIAIASPSFAFERVNPAFCRMLGYTADELLSMTFAEITHPDHREQDIAHGKKIAQGEIPFYQTEKRYIHKSGKILWGNLIVSSIRDEHGALRYYVSMINDITERKQAEETLRESEKRFRWLFERHSAIKLIIDPETGNIIDANEAAAKFYGWPIEKLKQMRIQQINILPPEAVKAEIKKVLSSERARFEFRHRMADGSIREVEVFSNKIDFSGKPCLYSIIHDITERKRAEEEKAELEARLQQAQKMESIGRLAGGVAHDFNNMLSVIIGNVEMAAGKIDLSEPLHADLTEIRKAAERSADLTRQLLAFARKQTVAPKVLDLNKTVADMCKMLQRIIGEDIRLDWQPGPDLWPVKVDPTQIDQILVNLCVNARNAITDVGRIAIATENSVFDAEYCVDHPDFAPGEYVRLAVSDDGCGMDKETLAHIFEPFFTTKGISGGVGLGLATVYGAVKQNNGFIHVRSEPDQGTTFEIYLPRHTGKIEQAARTEGTAKPSVPGHETILLVEDEPALLSLTAKMLEKQGYMVLAAATPGEAIHLARQHSGQIHLLLTDVVMPEMNGRDLAKNLLSLYPDLKRLFMSGYTANVIAHHGVLDEGVHFIQKPISIKDLAAKVREVLDSQ